MENENRLHTGPDSHLDILNSSLRNYIYKTGLPLREAAQRAELSPLLFLDWWIDKQARLDFNSIDIFLNSLQLSRERFLQTHHSISRLETPPMGLDALPEKYSRGAFSFISSSRHILSMFEMQYGIESVYAFLEKVNVPFSYFGNVENRINLRFFEDILEHYVVDLKNSPVRLKELSKALFLTVENTSLHSLFEPCATYEEAYQQIKDSTPHFDQNFAYKFSISASGVEIQCQPSEQLTEAMKSKNYGSALLYRYRRTLFENMVTLCGRTALPMITKKCISNGDPYCLYQASFK